MLVVFVYSDESNAPLIAVSMFALFMRKKRRRRGYFYFAHIILSSSKMYKVKSEIIALLNISVA